MATHKEFRDMTDGLRLEADCPLCGLAWPMCQGLCVAHESMNGRPGPFHDDYNDDCELCQQARARVVVEEDDGEPD
jgi:hypothetical protein